MAHQKTDEKILVIQRNLLFPETPVQGFIPVTNFQAYEQLIRQHQQFLWRSEMENDPAYKQVIPYLVFRHQDSYFLMRRRSDTSEARLKNKCTLGIGGHIRQEDIEGAPLTAWAHREFHEEVAYDGNLTITSLGLINDDSDLVGQVHVGFVFLLEGDQPTISIKEELKEGNLLTLDQMQGMYDQMENWSKLVYDFLVSAPLAQSHAPLKELS